MQENKPQFIAILVTILLCGYIVAPLDRKWPDFIKEAKIEKGIDVAGGAELSYKVLYPADHKGSKKDDTQRVIEVLRQRFTAKKGALLEPRLAARGDDLIVLQMPGIEQDKLKDYKRLITTIGRLELKKVASREIHEEYNKSGQVPAGYLAFSDVKGDRHGEEYGYIKDYVICSVDNVITGEDIKIANHTFQPGDGWTVHFELYDQGSKQFDDAAAKLFEQSPKGKIAIIVDNKLVSAPKINTPNFHGSGIIQGGFSEESSNELAIMLKSGSLPVAIGRIVDGKPVEKEPEAENFVGPSLGADSIFRSILASLISLVGGALFMILYYRAGGIIAVIGLAINLLFMVSLMSLFGATLTLPGLAGLALTVGMAVDANILIMERIREEMAKGKTAMQAFEAGYDRAFTTIMDSNVTTLIAGVVLYYFGTGAVQGFAVTLSIGIITTLISVLWCCKVFMRMAVQSNTITQWKMAQMFKTPNFNILKPARMAVMFSTLIFVGSILIVAARKDKQFGMDFKGGSMLQFNFAEAQEIDTVRKTVAGITRDVNGAKVEKYPELAIQTIAEPGAGIGSVTRLGQSRAREFQLRTSWPNLPELRSDIQNAFKGSLSHEPFEEVADLPANDRDFNGRGTGTGLRVWFIDDGKFKLDELDKQLATAFRGILDKDESDPDQRPYFRLTEDTDGAKGLKKVLITISKPDADAPDSRLLKVKEAIRKMAKRAEAPLPLARNPFVAEGNVGPSVAGDLVDKTIWALIISWVLKILYVAIRFNRIAFGFAAVIPLIHDSVIAVGFVSLMGAIVPPSLGLSFEMDMNTVAAVLTIIGYSINDKIVIFDRIRENLVLMKKESFAEIITTSVNQTMSRTVLTGFTVWLTCVALYLFTMTSGGGVSSFAFPMLMGLVVGTYSSVYISGPFLLWWFKGQKPVNA